MRELRAAWPPAVSTSDLFCELAAAGTVSDLPRSQQTRLFASLLSAPEDVREECADAAAAQAALQEAADAGTSSRAADQWFVVTARLVRSTLTARPPDDIFPDIELDLASLSKECRAAEAELPTPQGEPVLDPSLIFEGHLMSERLPGVPREARWGNVHGRSRNLTAEEWLAAPCFSLSKRNAPRSLLTSRPDVAIARRGDAPATSAPRRDAAVAGLVRQRVENAAEVSVADGEAGKADAVPAAGIIDVDRQRGVLLGAEVAEPAYDEGDPPREAIASLASLAWRGGKRRKVR
eukprot:Hpha_TRINITY_DN20068_c0_g1::TRINITY_DN20068_c0_g1_i1::g.147713::m.147713